MPFKSRADAREKARLGGLAKAAASRKSTAPPAPFTGSMLAMMDAAGLTGPSWDAWRCLWSVVMGRPLSDAQLALFTRATGRQRVPEASELREVWVIAGRRSGKSRAGAALFALWSAIRRQWSEILAPGEKAVVPVIARDRAQARQVIGYVKGLLALPALHQYAGAALKDSISLTTGARISVHTASWQSTRGYSSPAVVLDEVAFFATDEAGANPDAAILDALRPSMATIPGSMLFACSTPYAARGELFKAHQLAYGRDDVPDVLVWVLETAAMNPTVDPRVIARAFEADPVAAASEYGAEFRRDVAAFIDVEAVRACTPPDRRELPPAAGVSYRAFVDPSGGSVDSFTLAIAHAEGERAVLDCVRERRPPFSPEAVVAEFAATLKEYRLADVTGDHYAGIWPAAAFAKCGIRYTTSEKTKSDIYRELLPLVNAGRVELLALPRLAAQLVGLERRVARSGSDSIDHGPGGHDDVANVAAGALVLVEDSRASLGWSNVRVAY